jgi:NAD(P)-dependent dehydrogenase (short-subunit alcohol dehydrogenase family)
MWAGIPPVDFDPTDLYDHSGRRFMSKRILITGCSTGFGNDATKYLASKGHHVFATMRNVEGKNRAAADELRSFAEAEGVSVTVLEMDVTSDTSVAAAASALPTIDVLINNAGLGYGGPVESFSAEQVLAQLDLNIVGTVRAARAVLPGMRAQGSGLIIQISSVAGRGAFPGFGVYHASKWGLEGMSEAMRYELSPLGIDVVLIEPGPFSTNFFDNIIPGVHEEAGAAYPHVGDFMAGFEQQVAGAFEDGDAPTDPMLVVQAFEELIDTPHGQRPLRTIVGMDFGLQAVNDVVEPVRRATLEMMEIGEWDGPSAPE